MAKTRQEKESSVQQLTEKLTRMKTVVFVHHAGLTVKETTGLRRILRDQQIEFAVAKKTLFRKALADASLDPNIVDRLTGAVGFAFGYADEVAPAKLLAAYAKDHPSISFVGAIVQGQFLDQPQVIALAKLPGRDGLIQQTVWTIKAPLSGLVNVLSGNFRGLLNVLNALKDKSPVPSS